MSSPARGTTGTHHTLARRTIAAAASMLVLLGLLAAGSTPARATQDDRTLTAKELGLRTSALFGADTATTGWIPVEVRLAPTRLYAGTVTLIAATDVSTIAETREVEVAAGTEKVFRFVIPPAHRAQVRVAEAGRTALLADVRLPVRRSSGFLVGVLGEAVPAGAPPVAAVASDVRGTLVPVDPAWFDVSPRAIDSLSALVIPASQLPQLGDDAIGSIRNALTTGLELVVVADRPGPIDLAASGLPWAPATAATAATVEVGEPPRSQRILALTPGDDAWALRATDVVVTGETEPGVNDHVLIASQQAGRGRVSVIGVELGSVGLGGDARLWGHVLQPSARALQLADGGSSLHRPVSAAREAVRSRGLSLPSLPWLTVFLVAFVLLVGPLNGFVLRRIGRPELAWLTIPAITLVFATGAYAGARGAQPPVGLVASATYWIEGDGQQLAISALRSPREGEHLVTLPGSAWSVLPATTTATPARIDRASGDTRVTMDLGALQVGTVLAWSPTTAAPPLRIEATSTDAASVEVTVTNTGEATVRDLVIRAGTREQRVGEIAAGQRLDLTLGGVDTLLVKEPWSEDFDGLRDLQGAPVAPRSLEAVLRWSVLEGSPGLIWAIGTVDSATARGAIGSGPNDDLGGLIAVATSPSIDGAAYSPAVVDRALLPVGANQGLNRDAPTAIGTSGQAVLRYRLPATSTPVTQLVSTLHRSFDGMGGFEPREHCVEQPVFDANGVQVGANVVCKPVGNGEPPECPPNAECTFDGNLFEICRIIEDGDGDQGRECTMQIIEPAPGFDGRFEGPVSLEVFDHGTGRWEFLRTAAQADDEGRIHLEAARFVSPLGEVFVRASGEMWPFDFSGRGIGARLGGSA